MGRTRLGMAAAWPRVPDIVFPETPDVLSFKVTHTAALRGLRAAATTRLRGGRLLYVSFFTRACELSFSERAWVHPVARVCERPGLGLLGTGQNCPRSRGQYGNLFAFNSATGAVITVTLGSPPAARSADGVGSGTPRWCFAPTITGTSHYCEDAGFGLSVDAVPADQGGLFGRFPQDTNGAVSLVVSNRNALLVRLPGHSSRSALRAWSGLVVVPRLRMKRKVLGG